MTYLKSNIFLHIFSNALIKISSNTIFKQDMVEIDFGWKIGFVLYQLNF